jgi:hypothetical protein
MAPKAVRAWRGQEFSEEDMRWMALMHLDSVDAANDGYAMMALQPDPASSSEVDKKRQRLREKRERWWRRLRADAAGASGRVGGAGAAEGARSVEGSGAGGSGGGADAPMGGGANNSADDLAREVQIILHAAEKEETDAAAAAASSATSLEDDDDDDADPPPQAMTSDDAGDMVVMDTRVWHYGGANWSRNARVLLNVTFQEPGGDSGAARLRAGGWEEVDTRKQDPSAGGNRGQSDGGGESDTEVRRIHGFTYHCHESVTGRYCVADFL